MVATFLGRRIRYVLETNLPLFAQALRACRPDH